LSHDFSIPIRVYIEDTDAGGIVFYVNYLKYMERSRTELLRQLGLPKPAVLEEGMILVVASANIRYRRPAKLDDCLDVSAKITKLAKSYMVFEQKVFCDGVCLAEADIKVACVKRESMKACAFPDRIAQMIDT